ncbi:imidazole glycerol phosphate synthase subunit HisH [Adhaeribacter pallidiroseus]|uniref:Imidazole glycerol phosphate synthase subunit HisH n=1 Tax=Adhaeribacter pallidiroseus TaxID=2072847 RepID=A0A369QFK1_9BACT|nr:imidazole glycerol phosphate synthase subunit HisH [Adhaeribacter pallidiroseus]RDC63080.1 Imidazole glycerol phosphate synthase subunit HisH [Adhaeribacter pallidiroseus]
MSVVIIDYKGGNVQSVKFALERLGVEATLTADAEVIRSADKIIFPGEGEASSAMQELRERGLDKVIPELTQPFLGICLGIQLLCRHSEENDTQMLAIIPINVRRFQHHLKVPHMGWNNLFNLQGELFAGVKEQDYVYFVHSYYLPVCEYTIATGAYPEPFSAAVRYKNFFAMQFHTEKSGPTGTRIIENFLAL